MHQIGFEPPYDANQAANGTEVTAWGNLMHKFPQHHCLDSKMSCFLREILVLTGNERYFSPLLHGTEQVQDMRLRSSTFGTGDHVEYLGF